MVTKVLWLNRIMSSVLFRAAFLACLAELLTTGVSAATLEKLTIEQMTQKATLIVRGRVSGCSGEMHGSIIYTRCSVKVTERWKGQSADVVTYVVPGGSFKGLIQTFTGTPKFIGGDEYVLFLWAGRSGNNQIIGLTQGAFDITSEPASQAKASRAATSELMLDSTGSPVRDTPVQLNASELKARVVGALSQSGTAR